MRISQAIDDLITVNNARSLLASENQWAFCRGLLEDEVGFFPSEYAADNATEELQTELSAKHRRMA